MQYTDLKRKYIGLDVFRIVCAGGVCAFHTIIHLGANYGILQPALQMGAVFMSAFFLVSGFSLFVNYAGTDIIRIGNWARFLKKRIFGIIPLYYVVSMLYVIFRDGFDSLRQVILLAPIEALGIQSTFSSLFAFSHNVGTWFISCILICYLVYPLVQEILKQLTGKGKGILIGVCLGILLYSPIVVRNFNLMSTYSNPFFRVLEFILGAALASLKPEIDSRPFARHYLYRWSTVLFVTAGMLAGISAAVKAGFYANDHMMYSWICLPCFMLALLCLSGIESRQLEKSKGFAYCRSVSYAFFLAQLFSNDICKWLISRFSITHNLAVISLGWTVCILIAVGLHEIFEKPIAGVLRRKQIL